jgi:hypothetical protein
MALTQVDQGMLGTYAQYTGFKNRLINGACVIDQRKAGTALSSNAAGSNFTIDRWEAYGEASGKFSMQQNAGSVTPPAGFTNYVGITSLGANTPATGDSYTLRQWVEGFNSADLGFGAAGASTVTFSFWVRSSLTGTFSGVLTNYNQNRAYPFTFTISSANTWEYETVTIVGDTSGAWNTTNSGGIGVVFNLGCGATRLGTANAWATVSYVYGTTGSTNVLGTNGATFYVTGLQLEKGSTATSFDYLDYGRSLIQCQRYYQKSYAQATVPATSIGINEAIQFSFGTAGSGIIGAFANFPTPMRTDPTLTVYDVAGNSARVTILDTGAANTNNITLNTSNATQTRMMVRIYGNSAAGMCFMYQVSAEL